MLIMGNCVDRQTYFGFGSYVSDGVLCTTYRKGQTSSGAGVLGFSSALTRLTTINTAPLYSTTVSLLMGQLGVGPPRCSLRGLKQYENKKDH